MYYKFSFILVSVCVLFFCSPSQKTTLLHRNEATPKRISLNKTSIKNTADKVAITKGKTVEPISGKDLSKIIKSAAGRTHLFVFWTADCSDCITQMQAITAFANHSTTPDYQLVFVNLNTKEDLTTYSLQLHNRGLTNRSFWLNQSSPGSWQTLLPAAVDKNQPYVLAIQNDEGIFKHLKGTVSSEELHSFLQPLST